MIANKEIERIENSAVRLTLTIEQDYVRRRYDELVKDYAKKVRLDGFRPGKVPPEILERKFGESLKAETTEKVVEEGLRQALEEIEEQPLPYAQPQVDGELGLAPDAEGDFTFTVVYDVYPDVKVGSIEGHTIEIPKVDVTKDDIERELKKIQDQNAIVMEKEGAVEENDIATVTYAELDEDGNEVPDTRRKEFTFTVGSGNNIYGFDEDIVGMEPGATKTIEKTFPEDYQYQELAGTQKRIHVEVTSVKQRDLPPLDDELAQDVSDKYESLDDLKADLKERLERQRDQKLRETKNEQLLEAIVQDSEVPVPESMVQAELDAQWQSFIGQFGASEDKILQLLSAQGQSKESFTDQWRDGAADRIKRRLVVLKLMEQFPQEATDEDLQAFFEEQAAGSAMSADEAREHFEKNNMLDRVKDQISERKLFDAILEKNKIKTGKKTPLVDVLGANE